MTASADKGGSKKISSFSALRTKVVAEDNDDEMLSMTINESESDAVSDRTDRIDTNGVRHDPLKVIVATAMSAAMTKTDAAQLLGSSPLAMIVSVPAPEWVSPVKVYFSGAFSRKWETFARDASQRKYHRPTNGNGEVAMALAQGKSVVGIAVAVEQTLPSTLLATADVRLRLTLDADLIHKVIGEIYGGDVPDLDGKDLLRLTLDDIVAAMRPHDAAHEVAARIAAAATSRGMSDGSEAAPDLHTAVEWGAAREWGLTLARDMHDYRHGLISWSAVDRGAIFYSAPGMGKSVLARSIARACGVALVTGSMGELFANSSGNLDGVIKSMRDLFERATTAAPCILFLDEIDGLPSRDSLDSRNRDWWLPVIEDFMLLLDDATSTRREGVVVIGATNHVNAIDPAIKRPGRLERTIEVLPPGPEGILNVLRFHVGSSFGDDQLRKVADPLEGMTPAEIMELVRRARRHARYAGRGLSIEDLLEAALSTPDFGDEMLERIAVHEAGHVVVALHERVGRVKSVRIGGRGGAGGITSIDRGTDAPVLTRDRIERDVVGLLGGRAAEIVLLGAASTGAGGTTKSDLGQATRMLAAMSQTYGLGDDAISFLADAEEAHRQLLYDDSLRRKTDELLRQLQARAVRIVTEHRNQVSAIADALIKHSFLSEAEITSLVTPLADDGNALHPHAVS